MAEPVKTIADFLAVVRKSGLIDEAKLPALAELTAAWPDQAAELPPELPETLVAAELLTAWQVEQLRKGRHRGFMLGKYRLLRLLGAGGMSSVYLAWNTTLGELVAIKVLPAKKTKDQDSKSSFEDRFGQEAKIANKLAHQNIARAFDRDTVGSVQFIVMEYVDGTDLHRLVKDYVEEHKHKEEHERKKGLEIRDAIDYIRQAADGLHFAHQKGLVHRDIKPANLMLDREGLIKIMDLGLALQGAGDDDDQEHSLTRDYNEKVLGTVDYLSPEQAKDSHLADRRSDIYALGCTLHYLLVGRAPFAQGKLAERIQAHLNNPPPNLLDERPDVPPEIVELYFRMMAKNPDARPQTAEEVKNALAGWLERQESPARVGIAPPRRRAGPPGSGPPVFRSGPGSGSGRTSSISLGPPVRRPAAGSGVSRRGPAVNVSASPAAKKPVKKTAARSQSSDATTETDEENPRPRRRRPLEFAGYPLGMWVALVGGLIAVIVLGVLVYLRSTQG
jgi:eukaryotic-like serine/threonine-protein kinase